MNASLRIPTNLYQLAMKDLMRPHNFAFERIGFLFCRTNPDRNVLLAQAYIEIPDDFYIDDQRFGAVFSNEAIRLGLQRSLETQTSAILIHHHPHAGKPFFSTVDWHFISRIMPAFHGVSPESPHAAVIFSDDDAIGVLWPTPNSKPKVFDVISIVGFPSRFWRNNED